MRTHSDYSHDQEAIADASTWACIASILAEMGEDRIIGADEAVLRDAAEMHPGADRELVRDYFTYRPPKGDDRGGR